MTVAKAPPKPRPGLAQSLERGLVGLEMAFEGGVSPVELARALGVDRSTAYRFLQTLVMRGYLQHDPAGRKFVPNPNKFMLFARRLAESRDWQAAALRHLRLLRDLTQESANLAVMDGAEVVFIGHYAALETPTVLHALGGRRPVHCSATGKAILAFLPADDLARALDASALQGFTPKTITSRAMLELNLAQVRERGYATDDEETVAGVRCLAAPIFNHLHRVAASIGISGSVSHLTLARIPELGATVMQVARQASVAIGADGERPAGGRP